MVEGLLDGVAFLVADDEFDNLALVAHLLAEAAASVRKANSGRAALDLLSAWKPDVLLLDIAMPEMDGYELLAAFRRQPAPGDVSAVAVTVYASDQDRQRAADAGFDPGASAAERAR